MFKSVGGGRNFSLDTALTESAWNDQRINGIKIRITTVLGINPSNIDADIFIPTGGFKRFSNREVCVLVVHILCDKTYYHLFLRYTVHGFDEPIPFIELRLCCVTSEIAQKFMERRIRDCFRYTIYRVHVRHSNDILFWYS